MLIILLALHSNSSTRSVSAMLARRGTPSYPFTAPWPANRQRISLVLV